MARRKRATTTVKCRSCGLSFTTSDPPLRIRELSRCAFCGARALAIVSLPRAPRTRRWIDVRGR